MVEGSLRVLGTEAGSSAEARPALCLLNPALSFKEASSLVVFFLKSLSGVYSSRCLLRITELVCSCGIRQVQTTRLCSVT